MLCVVRLGWMENVIVRADCSEGPLPSEAKQTGTRGHLRSGSILRRVPASSRKKRWKKWRNTKEWDFLPDPTRGRSDVLKLQGCFLPGGPRRTALEPSLPAPAVPPGVTLGLGTGGGAPGVSRGCQPARGLLSQRCRPPAAGSPSANTGALPGLASFYYFFGFFFPSPLPHDALSGRCQPRGCPFRPAAGGLFPPPLPRPRPLRCGAPGPAAGWGAVRRCGPGPASARAPLRK